MSRFTRLLAFVTLLFVLAACGGDQSTAEVTTTEPASEESVAEVEADVEVVAGVPDGNEDEVQLSNDDAPIAPAAPVIASPAGRQDAQSVGGVEPEAEAADRPGASLAGDAEGRSTATGEGEQDAPAAFAGPVVDVPVYPTSTDGGSDQTSDAGDAVDAPSTPSTAAADSLPDLASDSCGADCEIGGFEPEVFDPQVVEQDALEPAAEIDGANFAELGPTSDELCPEGSSDDCVSEEDAIAAQEIAAIEEEVAELPTCENRPWMIGCDGPVPEAGDYEPQQIVEEDASSTGVQVPQDIQDLLLAPIDE